MHIFHGINYIGEPNSANTGTTDVQALTDAMPELAGTVGLQI